MAEEVSMQSTEAPRVWENQGINEVGSICLQASQADRSCEVVAGSSQQYAFGVKIGRAHV